MIKINNYVVYHLHSDISNPTTSMAVDSVTKFSQYLELAQQLEMKAICFSEHGNIMNWVKKKQYTEERGMKYIHANEVYVTEYIDQERGLVRDNYHYMLIAKNEEGVKELNKLTSISFNRDDGHFYYNPRLTIDEIINTSDNIIMTTACLASPLWQAKKTNNINLLNKLLEFFEKNKHRLFFEIQYHNHPEQIQFNQYLYHLHKEMNIPLIAGTDTHALNYEHLEARKVLMKAKNATYGDEDSFDLTFKTFDQLVEMFEKQNALPKDVFMEAIYNTNVMADMVEEFKLDTTPKYPRLYENSEEVFKEKINIGFKQRGFDKLEKEEKKKYIERIREEFNTYKKLDAIDYMLLQKNIIDWCHENGIYQGYGRGSVNGSIIAYVLGITEMDSIKHNLNFFRFLNPERISLPDIDTDFPPSKRQEVIDYVANLPGIHFSEIITFNTVALKGAIREVGRALEIPLKDVDQIAKSVYKDDDNNEVVPQEYIEKYPTLFKYVNLIKGVIISIGSHPSGFIVSPISLNDNIGLCYTKESKYAVSQINMKELDSLNYVKLDILGLDNIEIINETCKLAGIERITPDKVNDKDENVWKSIRESGLNIFQWESDSAQRYLKDLLSDETIQKIKEQNPDFSYIDLFSIGNGAIRPSGESYRNDLAKGIFKDNGHEGINEFLRDTMGYLVYQEQIMNWLVKFCSYTPSESDSVRRAMAKKETEGYYEKIIKPIEERFYKTMDEKYNIKQEEASKILKDILQVIDDAQRYGFSLNHSKPYSYIGYICGYLRYYYPLEFLTVALNINKDNIEKTAKIAEYAKIRGIEIRPIKFRKSRSVYELSKEENAIYKGISSIKHLNSKIAEELYKLKDNKYDTFTDLLVDIEEKTSVNSRQLEILIKLNYFSEFGGNNELLEILNVFKNGKEAYKKALKNETKQKRIEIIKNKEILIKQNFKEKKLSPIKQIEFEKEVLGYPVTTYNLPEYHWLILNIDTKYSPKLTLYNLVTGQEHIVKMNRKTFDSYDLDVGLILKNLKVEKRFKTIKTEKGFEKTNEYEYWLINGTKTYIT